MSRLPIYSNVSRWVFSGGHSASPAEPEYGYMNYIHDWNSAYMRPHPPSFRKYDRVGGYYPAPFGFSSSYPEYLHVSAYYPEAMYYSGRAPRHHHDRIYEKPVQTREKEIQRHRRKEKHETKEKHEKKERHEKKEKQETKEKHHRADPDAFCP